jgi:DnaK suppressor protein
LLEQKQIRALKNILLELQQDLLALEKTGDDAASIVELDQTRVGRLSRMDALQDQAMSQERVRRRQVRLQQISAALGRIGHEDYGYCVECGDEIAYKRLQFDPTATLCFNCANDKDPN